jgi:holo-[acyl-carrier-protein] synthase
MIEGSGIDIVEIERFKEAHQRWGDSFLRKIFTREEINYSLEKRFPYQHLSARFAAKEATLKAFGNGWGGLVSLNLIEIFNDKDGKPHIKLKGDLEKLYKERNLADIVVSMSHSKRFAVASCILVKNGKDE